MTEWCYPLLCDSGKERSNPWCNLTKSLFEICKIVFGKPKEYFEKVYHSNKFVKLYLENLKSTKE